MKDFLGPMAIILFFVQGIAGVLFCFGLAANNPFGKGTLRFARGGQNEGDAHRSMCTDDRDG